MKQFFGILKPCLKFQAHMAGAPGEKAMVTSKFLAKTIESCSLIDKKTLCIVPNKVAWCIYCDVICVDYDGNLADASLLALVAALQNTKLPKVTYDSDSEKISVEKESTEKLEISNTPTSTTITVYSSDIHLLDPTAEDEKEGNGEVTLVLKDSNTLCMTHKSGGSMVPPEILENFLGAAKNRGKVLKKIIRDALR